MNADRFPCLFGGERSGKSWAAVAILLPHVIALPFLRYDDFFFPSGNLRFNPKTQRPGNPHFMLYGPNYKEPRVEFEYLEDGLRRLGKLQETHLSKPTDGPWRLVTTDGVVVATFSLENPESVRSVDLEGAMVCEAGGCPYSGIERVRGRVAAKRGFIIYVGTLEKSERWWQEWQSEGKRENVRGIKTYIIPTWTNTHEFPGGREDPEIKSWWATLAMTDPDLPLERLAAVARPLRERVVNMATEKNIKTVEFPDDAWRIIGVDPGWATAHAVIFVARWNEGERVRFHVFDEFYEQHVGTEQMINLCRTKPYWHQIRDGVIDIAAKGHRDGLDKSALEVWRELTDIRWRYKMWPEDITIERLNTSFGSGQVTVDPKCQGLIAELGLGQPVFPEQHPWKRPTDRDGRVLGEKPIDRWNHCHDEKTEILTDSGWVPFPELKTGQRVAVWADGEMNYEVPTDIVVDDYSGPLLVREGNNVNFAVTPNHRMWIARQYSVRGGSPEYSFSEAANLPARTWLSRVAPGWSGTDPRLSFRQRTKTGYHTITPEPSAFARFYGFWLAEGCLGRGGGKRYVIVDQKSYVDQAREIVAATGFNWCETKRKDGVVRFSIQSRELYDYLCGDGIHKTAETKSILREWLNASPDTLRAMLDGYRLGDGSRYGEDGWWYGCSVSKKLVDDLQEAAFKCGMSSNVYLAIHGDGVRTPDKWYISFSGETRGSSAHGLVTLSRDDIKREHYTGKVYCVTTAAGVIATRRNGRVMWGGNSAKALGYLLLDSEVGIGQVERRRKTTSRSRMQEIRPLKGDKRAKDRFGGYASW